MPPRRRARSAPNSPPRGRSPTRAPSPPSSGPSSPAESDAPADDGPNLARLIQKPRFFDGRGHLTAWLFSVLTYITLCAPNITEPKKILLAGSFLSGYALTWFRSNAHKFKIFEHFEKALRRQFGDMQISTTCRHRLQALNQGHNTVSTYTSSFNELALQIGQDFMESEEGYHAFIRGLRDDVRINVVLALKGDHNTIEAQMLAAEYDAAKGALFRSGHYNRPRVNAMHHKDMSHVRCYYCNQLGHVQRTCPARAAAAGSPRSPPPPPPRKNR